MIRWKVVIVRTVRHSEQYFADHERSEIARTEMHFHEYANKLIVSKLPVAGRRAKVFPAASYLQRKQYKYD